MSNSPLIAARALAIALALALAPAAFAQRGASYSNPVVAHDYPDPSVIRTDEGYWVVATAGTWAPLFTIMHSRDLVNWRVAGAVFDEPPAWAENSFWAPELVEYRGRYFVYYTARKQDGPLCVAVASAPTPVGPYTDHGALVCQEIGSIDADMVEGDDGELYLFWKEDGNSRNRPTPIWAQKLAADGITLEGEPKELIRNDVAWEGGVVEGTYVLKRGDWYYMFYSGNACCGRECNYALGVARARSILGPWEKNPKNPILAENASWRCPGHGTVVTTTDGRDYMLYHSYRKSGDYASVGRLALLDRIEWKANGWPAINEGRGPSDRAPAPHGAGNRQPRLVIDTFDGDRLDPNWRWILRERPEISVANGRLGLSPRPGADPGPLAAVVARPHISGSYDAVVRVVVNGTDRTPAAGISALSWRDNAVGIAAGAGRVTVWRIHRGQHEVIATAPVPARATSLLLRIRAEEGKRYRFAFSRDGKRWRDLGGAVDGSHMEFAQLALTAGDGAEAGALFDEVRVTYR